MSGAAFAYGSFERGSAFVGSRGRLSDEEVLFVARHHYRGASGQAIARMLNRPVIDVEAIRARLDPLETRHPVLAPDPSPEPIAEPVVVKLQTTVLEQVTIGSVAIQVGGYYRISIDELRGPARTKEIVEARQAAFYSCREVRLENGLPRWSLPQIGRWFGGRDHTTVLHGVRQHKKRLAEQGRAA